MVVWEDASARKFGWLSTPEMSASAKMNAAVAVRKSNPTKTAVFLVDVVRAPFGCTVEASVLGVVIVDMWISLFDSVGAGRRAVELCDGCIDTREH